MAEFGLVMETEPPLTCALRVPLAVLGIARCKNDDTPTLNPLQCTNMPLAGVDASLEAQLSRSGQEALAVEVRWGL